MMREIKRASLQMMSNSIIFSIKLGNFLFDLINVLKIKKTIPFGNMLRLGPEPKLHV